MAAPVRLTRVKWKSVSALVAVVGFAALLPAAPSAAAPTPAQSEALAREAYIYGFPLLEFLRVRKTEGSVRCPDGKGNGPLNNFSNAKGFATPADRTVVAPNVDTLYSIAQLDLGKGPIVLSHPDMGKRYFVFEFLDPYTNVVGYVRGKSHPDRFVVVTAHYDHLGVRGGQVYNGADDNASGVAVLMQLAAHYARETPRAL